MSILPSIVVLPSVSSSSLCPFCLGGGEGRTGPGDTGEGDSCSLGGELAGLGETEGDTLPRTLSAQLFPFFLVSNLKQKSQNYRGFQSVVANLGRHLASSFLYIWWSFVSLTILIACTYFFIAISMALTKMKWKAARKYYIIKLCFS